MRAIVVATRAEADELRAKVDAEHGYPRCDRLADTIAPVQGRVLTCPCADANNPHPDCHLATRAETLPIELEDGTWAYPVRETEDATMAALDAQELATIVSIANDGLTQPAIEIVDTFVSAAPTRTERG